jgi:hypothetical protein
MKVYKVDYELRFANTEWIEADTPEEAQEQLATLAFLDYKVLFDEEALEFDDFVVVSVVKDADGE